MNEIISHPTRMPFTQQISFTFQLFVKLVKYFIFLGVFVMMFYLILIFILNPVVFVIIVVVLYFIFISLAALEEKIYGRYKNKPLSDFIKKVN